MRFYLPLILVIFLSINSFLSAQVGINTNDPKATLHVHETTTPTTPDGIIAPKLTGAELKAKDNIYTSNQTGAIVYVTQGLAAENLNGKNH